jgi:hypothetical protein
VSGRAPRLLPLLLVVALAGAGVRAAHAGDPAAVAALLKEIADAKAAKEASKWAEGLKHVPALYADAEPANQKALMAELGAGLKSKEEEVRGCALGAMIETKDGDAAWKAGLKGEMPDLKAEAVDEFSLRAVDAVHQLHPDGAVPSLLALVDKAKDPKAVAAAFKAFGGYERSRQRVVLLETAMKFVKLNTPGVTGGGKASTPTPKWQAVEPEVVPTLNELTGATNSSIADWVKAHEDAKKRPDALFKNPLK